MTTSRLARALHGGLDDLARDVRHGLRTLRAAPSFTAVAAATIALGVGASTAIFSAVYGILIEPLPFRDQSQLVAIYQNNTSKGVAREPVAPGNFAEWENRSSALVAMGAVEPFGLTYTAPEGPEMLPTYNVTRGFFPALGTRPFLGRVFDDADYLPHRSLSLVLSYGSWRRRFGGDPGIIGRSLTIAGAPAMVIGVLPQDFSYLGTQRGEVFAPKVLDSAELNLRSVAWYSVIARLKHGVTIDEASGDLNRVARQLGTEYPATNRGSGVTVVPLRDGIVGNARAALLLLFGGVGIVLVIACANVGNLLAARAGQREHEFALRVALGAGKMRMVRQVLAECLVLSLTGGASGVALAYGAVGAIRSLAPASLPRTDEIRVSAAALAFALVVTLVTTLAVGVAPALRAARSDPVTGLRSGDRSTGGPRAQRMRRLLASLELALTVMLLIGAGLLTRSFGAVVRRDWGYRADHLIAATLFVWRSAPTDAARVTFVRRLVERVRALPGVRDAGVTSNLPLMESIGLDYVRFVIVGRPGSVGSEPTVHVTSLTPGALAALRVRLRGGRWFSTFDDSTSARVAIINESLARRFWPGEDPLGRRVRIAYHGPPLEREIVGIVDDVPTTTLDGAAEPSLYLPFEQAVTGDFAVIARTDLVPDGLTGSLRRAVAAENPQLPVAEVHTLDALVAGSLKPRRFVLALFGCFSLTALVLAMVGVYGVNNQATLERARELGVRMALGAEPWAVVRLVMVQGVVPALGGLAAGLVGAGLLTRVIRRLLFGVGAVDALTFAGAALLVLAAAALACYLPARRAARADLLDTLRSA